MKISEHADHTEQLYGIRAEDIHKWIDGYFDREGFDQFLQSGSRIGRISGQGSRSGHIPEGYDPYGHRKFRHCREALPEAIREFSGRYSSDQVKRVFERHVRDDYNNYIPTRADFSNGKFSEKYHEADAAREPILTSSELARYFRGRSYTEAAAGRAGLNRAERGNINRNRADANRADQSRPADRRSGKQGTGAFRLRIVLPAMTALVLFIAVQFLVVLPLFHNSLMREKETALHSISSVAVSALDYYISLEAYGTLTREEAQAAAIDELQKLRYGEGNENYFWITDMQPVMIMHPWHPELVGQDLADYTDQMNRSGKHLFVESVELVRSSGGGFLEYLWQLDAASSRIVPKLSYVQGVEPWGWIVGTGFYIHDVEEEIARFTRTLVQVLIGVTLFLILLLIYLVVQSRRIERNRRQAEAGLVEAKERYRALVEASNEGYLLLLDGETVFVSPALMRMTGYGEDEMRDPAVWYRLFPGFSLSADDAATAGGNGTGVGNGNGNGTGNGVVIGTEKERDERLFRHLRNMLSSQPDQDEFEARIVCGSGARLDVIIRVSRIFLTEQNGQVIVFRPISRTPQAGFVGALDALEPFAAETRPGQPSEPGLLLKKIESAETDVQVVRLLHQLPNLVRILVTESRSSADIRAVISKFYSTAQRRLLELALEQLGRAPGPYALIALGSSGRGEMTLFSDQDNALVFESGATGDRLEKERLYYLKAADLVCSRLDQAGFSYCPGGIMAVNPAYCLSVNEWRAKYHEWIFKADEQALLDTHVFFDLSPAGGDEKLVEHLQTSIFNQVGERPEFLTHFARSCLQYKPPIGILGAVRTEERDGQAVINVKECLIPIINAARLYALRERIPLSSTLQRLQALRTSGVLEPINAEAAAAAFEKLWELRFTNQILAHGELRKVNDDLSVASLSESDRRQLQKALSTANGLLTRLSYDFLGLNLM